MMHISEDQMRLGSRNYRRGPNNILVPERMDLTSLPPLESRLSAGIERLVDMHAENSAVVVKPHELMWATW